MNDTTGPMLTVNLPASLVARVEELKQERTQDRDKSIEALVREWCEDYVAVRELARQERTRLESINRAYQEHPGDWDDAQEWRELPAVQEKLP